MRNSVLFLPALLSFALAGPLAAEESDVGSQFMRCAEIENPPLRYACYDETAARVKAAAAIRSSVVSDVPAAAVSETVPAPSIPATPDRPVPEQGEKRRFGFLPQRRKVTREEDFGVVDKPDPISEPREITSVSSGIQSFEVSYTGKVTVQLANGQIWKQIDGDSSKMTESRMRRQTNASVKQAALGSYMMTLEPSSKAIRVRRVR